MNVAFGRFPRGGRDVGGSIGPASRGVFGVPRLVADCPDVPARAYHPDDLRRDGIVEAARRGGADTELDALPFEDRAPGSPSRSPPGRGGGRRSADAAMWGRDGSTPGRPRSARWPTHIGPGGRPIFGSAIILAFDVRCRRHGPHCPAPTGLVPPPVGGAARPKGPPFGTSDATRPGPTLTGKTESRRPKPPVGLGIRPTRRQTAPQPGRTGRDPPSRACQFGMR